MLTLVVSFGRVIHAVTCHRPARERPSKYMGGLHQGEVVLQIGPPLFYFGVLVFFSSGALFLGGFPGPFSWPETGRTFRDHGGSPRLSAPQGDRFLGAKSVTIFWARNWALAVQFFFHFWGPKKSARKVPRAGSGTP